MLVCLNEHTFTKLFKEKEVREAIVVISTL